MSGCLGFLSGLGVGLVACVGVVLLITAVTLIYLKLRGYQLCFRQKTSDAVRTGHDNIGLASELTKTDDVEHTNPSAV